MFASFQVLMQKIEKIYGNTALARLFVLAGKLRWREAKLLLKALGKVGKVSKTNFKGYPGN